MGVTFIRIKEEPTKGAKIERTTYLNEKSIDAIEETKHKDTGETWCTVYAGERVFSLRVAAEEIVESGWESEDIGEAKP